MGPFRRSTVVLVAVFLGTLLLYVLVRPDPAAETLPVVTPRQTSKPRPAVTTEPPETRRPTPTRTQTPSPTSTPTSTSRPTSTATPTPTATRTASPPPPLPTPS